MVQRFSLGLLRELRRETKANHLRPQSPETVMTPLQLLPCPFCKSVNIDPKGWLAGDGSFGPQCMMCGATAESKEKWNTRPTSASDAEKERKFMDLLDNPAPPNDALKSLLRGASCPTPASDALPAPPEESR